jgi:hypothetical protein
MEDFKGNSNASKEASSPIEEKKVITPIAVNVTENKPNVLSKFKHHILSSDAGSVGEYVVTDVIIPKVQSLIVESFKYMIDFIFYGKNEANNPNRRNGVGTVSYSNYYRPSGSTIMPQVPVSAYSKPSTVYQVKDIVFDDRGQAEEVLISMQECINKYGSVTVGDFYDMIGQHGTYTDQKYGWKDLSSVGIVRSGSGGFRIDFPKISPVE